VNPEPFQRQGHQLHRSIFPPDADVHGLLFAVGHHVDLDLMIVVAIHFLFQDGTPLPKW
jgi:hypothetical protein